VRQTLSLIGANIAIGIVVLCHVALDDARRLPPHAPSMIPEPGNT
jgi:hypothetical protein